MRATTRSAFVSVIFTISFFLIAAYRPADTQQQTVFPYKNAGLTPKQAAAHLLSRFTYGYSSDEVDKVVKMGLETWFEQQLSANLPDSDIEKRLKGYDAINLTNSEVINLYPEDAALIRMGIAEGAINKDSLAPVGTKSYKDQIKAYQDSKGLKSQTELFQQLIIQKILRARYSNNQLREILTDFWFNHFNVSITKSLCAEFVPAYEREAIRPNVLGKFEDMVVATAQAPAMLFYLDNFSSVGIDSSLAMTPTKGQSKNDSLAKAKKLKQAQSKKGLNENYARELMELHTLGVDGGYSQRDVTEAARILTGWTVYPIGTYANAKTIDRIIEKVGVSNLEKKGFVKKGDFLFVPNLHDKGEKVVLKKKFAANGGYNEGLELLEMLAHHPSTAKFISRKLATRFVNDTPPQSLINKMAVTFNDSKGDIKEVLKTMVSAPEFWSQESLRQKTKSPFELVISTTRGLHADIKQPYQLFRWISKMGQRLYFYNEPTGFPDRGQFWINTGSLLNRMNFGMAITGQRIPGVSIDLLALADNHEPESASAALKTYGEIILAERDLAPTIKRLTPLLNDPQLVKKLDKAAGDPAGMEKAPDNKYMLAQVVGIIIGSPEFQRR